MAAPSAGTATQRSLQSVRARAVAWAVSQEGHAERRTTNCSSRITRWQRQMGIDAPPCEPWCGAYVHQAFLRGGVRLSKRIIDPHRSYADAVAGRRGLQRIPMSAVRKGDLLFFRIRRGLRASHLAIVRERPAGQPRAHGGGQRVAHGDAADPQPLRAGAGGARHGLTAPWPRRSRPPTAPRWPPSRGRCNMSVGRRSWSSTRGPG